MRIIFVIAVLFVIGSIAGPNYEDDIFDNSDESAFEPDDSDESDNSGESDVEAEIPSQGKPDEPSSPSQPIPSKPVQPTPVEPEPVAKIEIDKKWKKTGVEDASLRAAAYLHFDDPERAKLWIRRGANVNGKEKDTLFTPLHKTAFKDNVKVARLLIQNGANVNAKDSEGRTPLNLAKSQGSTKVAELLTKNGGEENKEKEKEPEIVPQVPEPPKKVEKIVEPAKELTLEEMLLDYAFQPGDNVEEVNSLIEIGIDVDTKSELVGETSLHRTAYKDNVFTARALLSADASINALDESGRTPLVIAAVHGSMKVAKALIQKGADLNVGDSMGNTALHEAIKFGNTEIAKLLVESGADVNAGNCFKETPFHWTYLCDNPGFVRFMIQKGAKIELRDTLNRNARDYMKQYGNMNINFEIDRLLEEAEQQNRN